MTSPIIQPSPRWYWTVPFASGAWNAVSSLNPFVGPESGSAASSASNAQYFDSLDHDPWEDANFTNGCCWDHNFFYSASGNGSQLDVFRTDRFLIADPVLMIDGETSAFQHLSHHLLAFPEQGYMITVQIPEDAQEEDVHVIRYEMDGANGTFLATLHYDDNDAIAENPTATREFIDFVTSDREGGKMFSRETVSEYVSGVLTEVRQRIVMMDVESGDREILYEITTLPAPANVSRLWHPTWSYTLGKVLVPEEETTGEVFTGGDEGTGKFDRVNVLTITTGGTPMTLFSYLEPTIDDEGTLFPKMTPIIAWTSDISRRLYHEKAPLPASPENRTDADVGLFTYALDGTGENRLCNDPREQNFGWEDFAINARTALGPGTRAPWEL